MQQQAKMDDTGNGRATIQQGILGAALKQGDHEIFAHFIRSNQRQIYALIWRMLRNHEDCNDILQDAFFRFYQNLDKLHNDRPALPYLRRIAINLSINKLKSTKRMLSLDHAFEIADNHAADCDVEHNELLEAAQKALKKLPREQQLVFLLRVQDGLSYQEIAYALHVKVGTVMSRLARAREKLFKAVRKHGKPQKDEIVQ